MAGVEHAVTTNQTAPARRLLFESTLLYGSIYFAVFCHFLSGFIIAKILGPSLYGLRTVFGLVEQYEPATSLGTFNAMEREVPYHRSRGDGAEADRIERSVWTANLAYGAAICALLVGLAPVVRRAADPIYADFLYFLAGFVLLGRIERFALARLIIDKRTGAVGRLRVVQGVATTSASVSLVAVAGLRGLFVGILAGKLAVVVYALASLRALPALGFSWPIVRRTIAIGFPIMAIKFLFILFQTADKVLIAAILSREMLGYFAVGAILSGVVFLTLAEAVKVVFSSRMMEALGAAGDVRAVEPYFSAPTAAIAWLAPVAVGVLYLTVHIPIEHFMPHYRPAIPVAKVLLLGQYFFAVITVALLTCISLNRQVALLAFTAGGVALDGILNTVVLRMGLGIYAVAVCTGVSYLVYALALLAFTAHLFRPLDAATFARTLLLPIAPWTVCVLLVAGLDDFIPVSGLGFADDVAASTLRVVTFLFVYGAVLAGLSRHPAFTRVTSFVLHPRAAAGPGI